MTKLTIIWYVSDELKMRKWHWFKTEWFWNLERNLSESENYVSKCMLLQEKH